MIDLSLSSQKASKARLGIIIMTVSLSSDKSSYYSACSCIYLSIYNAEGPVGTSKFLKTLENSFYRKFNRFVKKISISALLVENPFFFLIDYGFFYYFLLRE
jgi:hypothetical protein